MRKWQEPQYHEKTNEVICGLPTQSHFREDTETRQSKGKVVMADKTLLTRWRCCI